MATTPALDVTHLEPNQAQPDVTVNSGFDKITTSVADYLVIDIVADTDYTFATGTGVQDWHHAQIRFTDTGVVLTAARNVIVPDEAKLYVFQNDTAQTLTIKTSAGVNTVVLPATEGTFVRCDGTEVYLITAGGSGGAAGADALAFDPTTVTDADLTLSGDNLTVEHNVSSGRDGVRATRVIGTVPIYYEVLMNSGAGAISMSLVPATSDLQDNFLDTGWVGLSVGHNEAEYRDSNDDRHILDSEGRTALTLAMTDVVSIAVDPRNGYVWIGKNNVWLDSGDPAAGTDPYVIVPELIGGEWYPAIQGGTAWSCTARFAQGDWTGTVPAGFVEAQLGAPHDGLSDTAGDQHPRYFDATRGDERYVKLQAAPRLEPDTVHGSDTKVYEPEGRRAFHSGSSTNGGVTTIYDFGPTDGVYAEFEVTDSTSTWMFFGAVPPTWTRTNRIGDNAGDGVGYRINGTISNEGTDTSGFSTASAGDVIGLAVRVSTGQFWVRKNGTWEAGGNPAAGTGANATDTNIEADWFFGISQFQTNECLVRLRAADLIYEIPDGFAVIDHTPLHDTLRDRDDDAAHPQYVLKSDTVADLLWDDLRTALTAAQGGGLNDPNWAQVVTDGSGSTGIYSWHFDDTTEEELFFEIQLPHGYSPGTDVKPHVHWAPKDGTTGDVVWGLEYTVVNVGDVIGNSTILTVTDAAPGTALEQAAVGFSAVSGTGLQESTVILCRFYRDATNVADTYAADAIGLSIDFHIQLEKRGTVAEFP